MEGHALAVEETWRCRRERAIRVVCLGGGTGLPMVLRGLAGWTRPRPGNRGVAITAVVAMSDDGGSSGRLKRGRGMVPAGDVRNCLAALAPREGPLREIFQYRFPSARDALGGHAVGNLLLAALTELRGDFVQAVRGFEGLLGARGRVLPSTTEPVRLVARDAEDHVIVGERRLRQCVGRVVRVGLEPANPAPCVGILDAIHQADLLVLGPGSLYSSVLPNLLVDGVAEAVRCTRAMRVLVMNLMTQPGETAGMSATDHVRALFEHAGPVVDSVLLNAAALRKEGLARYAEAGAEPVRWDRRELLDCGVMPVEADLLGAGRRIRHDGRKVARWLVRLAKGEG